MTTIEELEEAFAKYPSINASSIQEFEAAEGGRGGGGGFNPRFYSPQLLYPSHHSGFRSDTESDLAESISGGRYSPPAWRRDGNGNRSSGFWKRGPRLEKRLQESRDSSPEYDIINDGELDLLAKAARTRLPSGSLSPEKRRSPSPSPVPASHGNGNGNGNGNYRQTWRENNGSKNQKDQSAQSAGSSNNFIRFAVRAEVQHKTEPFEAACSFVKAKIESITHSWISILSSLTIIFISISVLKALFQPGATPPVPDLIKVAGLAKSFEPLIYYSENGIQQVGDLQATGIAVWDLGESVRTSNMTSAPIIVKELDDLSENLKILAIELTRFFANVDGDVDGILIVMDWARRELSQLETRPSYSFISALENMHTLFRRCGILETPAGGPTRLGAIITSIFGLSTQQRTQATLQKTFQEFLSVLEEAIDTELNHSLALFSLFTSIDHRFLNIARIVTREAYAQDSAQDDMLSSLWTKILGPNSSALHKFEKNKRLLGNIRSKTVQNKSLLEDHNRKLLTLKANLENLRRKVVSPLLRANASTIGVEEQIRGLEDASGYLGGVRDRQRGKLMEILYGSGRDGNRPRISDLGDNVIDSWGGQLYDT
ncbi:hypothetical protein K3495_g3554 [Podosphaera aphanis]|nr:hypothetical protein K3495_g3554 [Podosphaera aphanis]